MIKLFIPVSCCMLVVIITMASVNYYATNDSNVYLAYAPFVAPSDNAGVIALQSLGNAAIIICVVIVMTLFLIVLYKKRCYKFIWGWLIMSSMMLLTMFSYAYLL